MTNTKITTGTKVTYTNRKGTVLPAIVLEVLPTEVFGQPVAVIEYTGGHVVGVQQRKPLTDLVVVD